MRQLILCFLLCQWAWAAPASYQAVETSRVAVPNGPILTTSRIFVRGQQLRREPQIANPTYRMVTVWDLKTGASWLFLPKLKQYTEGSLDDSGDGWHTLLQSRPGRLLKTEALNGHQCEVRQAGPCKLWVDKQTGFQIRRELKTENGFLRTFDYAQFTTEKVPDELFTIPAGYQKGAK